MTSTLHICWASQAGLYYHYGVPKYSLEEKCFGVFPHTINEACTKLLRGFDEMFFVPHSRHTEVRREDIAGVDDLVILSESEEAGIYLVSSRDGKQILPQGIPSMMRTPEMGVRPGRCQRHGHRAAAQLLSERRSNKNASVHMEGTCKLIIH